MSGAPPAVSRRTSRDRGRPRPHASVRERGAPTPPATACDKRRTMPLRRRRNRCCAAPGPRRLPAMPRNGAPAARAHFLGARASRPHLGNPQRRSPGATQPRRRRGPGPRASCPHVPAHRSIAAEGAVVAPRRAPRIPAMPRNGARARFPDARASRPHIGNPQRRSPGATQPRRRRGPGPRASCPHVSTPPKAGPGTAGVPARTSSPRRRRGLGARASRPHVPARRGVGGEPRAPVPNRPGARPAPAVSRRRHMPHASTAAPASERSRRRNIFSSQLRFSRRSNTTRCPASAPQRSM